MHQIGRRVKCCQEDNRYISQLWIFLHDDSRIKTIDIWHHHVEKYQVRMLRLGLFNTCLSTIRRANLELLVCQQNLQQQYVAHHVIDNQNLIVAAVDFRL